VHTHENASGARRGARDALLVLLAVALPYANSLGGPFVFDDPLPGTTLHFRTRPLVWASFALDRALSGAATWSDHLFNAAVHLACGLALLGVLRRALALARPAESSETRANLALAVTLLWLCHPLQTATVTYLSQRAESLAALGILGALYGFLRALDASAPRRWQALALASLAFGFLAKETAAVAPLLLLLAELALVPGEPRANLWRRWRFHALFALATAGLFLAFVAQRLFAPDSSSGFGPHESFGALGYLRTQPGVVLHYLRLAAWPAPLVFDYAWPLARELGEWLPQALVLGALLVLALVLVARRAPLGFALAAFFLLLAPSSSVVPIKDLAFEHRMYLPLAPVLVLVALGARRLCARVAPRAAWLPAALTLAGVLALALATARRNRDYASAVALWQSVVAAAPHNARAHNNLAAALLDEDRIDEAEPELARALELAPATSALERNLARIAAARGELEPAMAHLERAIALQDSAAAQSDLALLLRATDRAAESEPHLVRALELEPKRVQDRLELGRLLLMEGRAAEALAQLVQAADAPPDTAEKRLLLGQALASLGRGAEALDAFRRAAALDPASVEAREGAARLLDAKTGASADERREALALAEAANALCSPHRADVLETLANAHAALGEFEAAIAALEEALTLPGPQKSAPLAARLRARLDELRARH